MLKKLRGKFVLINMSLVGVTLFIAAIVVCVIRYSSVRVDMMTSMQAQLEQYSHPDGMDMHQTEIGVGRPQINTEIPILIVRLDKSGNEITTLSDSVYIEESTLNSAIGQIRNSSNLTGTIDGYGLTYMMIGGDGDTTIAFADSGYPVTITLRLGLILALCFVGFMTLLFFISLFLANTAIRPIDRAWEQQKRFVADASHELKTPLTVILANNRIVKSHAKESVESQSQWLDSTEDEAEQMRSLIADMLSLAQIEASEGTRCFSEVNLSKAVSRAYFQFEAVAYEKGVAVNADIEEGIVISGDESKLRQLFATLIDNAIKYEPKDGRVDISLRKKSGRAIFSVTNHGSVIDKEDIPYVFDRFYRADASRSSDGSGLGLAIAKNIAAMHKGALRVTSCSAEGTTFVAVL